MKKREAYRTTNAPMTEAETWDACVAQLIGPVVKPADREQRHRNALALAAAAMRAANNETGLHA
ncbi:hypothetical protein ACYT84_09220 [Ralstonia solanacearum]|uniref:hypothetical protein n=1 Tax=Ralstonia solanacearum TaxID=305 RepID=UPI0018D00302|nr:hypothetical protein [Ralstonia solanacearum]